MMTQNPLADLELRAAALVATRDPALYAKAGLEIPQPGFGLNSADAVKLVRVEIAEKLSEVRGHHAAAIAKTAQLAGIDGDEIRPLRKKVTAEAAAHAVTIARLEDELAFAQEYMR